MLDEPTETELRINERDLVWRTFRGSGAGGQHRNTTDSAVEVTHIPTGIIAKQESDRSQHRNRANALAVLRAKVSQYEREKRINVATNLRRSQVGSGQRGDKRRTIRMKDGTVSDHVTGRRWRLKDYLRGDW